MYSPETDASTVPYVSDCQPGVREPREVREIFAGSQKLQEDFVWSF